MYPIVAITGATGTTKTALATSVAKQTGATVLPLDQLQRYKHLQEGTGLAIEKLRDVKHFGYQILSPWEISGPDKYVTWLRNSLERVAEHGPVVIEGGCTSYLKRILSCSADPILGQIKVIALDINPDEAVNLQRIKTRVSPATVRAVLQETERIEKHGFISEAGLPFLVQCESLWKHPDHEDPTLAWAIRISARVYCPSYLALKGKITFDSARDRIVRNVADIQRYQATQIRSVLPRHAIFAEQGVCALAQDIVTTLSARVSGPNQSMHGSRKTLRVR